MEEKEVIRRIRREIHTLLQKEDLSPCSVSCLSQTRDLLDVLCFELGLDVEEQGKHPS